jgi:hypothetical protein
MVKTKTKTTSDDTTNEEGGTNDRSEETVRDTPLKQSDDVLKSFDDEFYFQLTVYAKLKSKTLETTIADDEGYDDDINLTTKKKTKEQKRKMEHKLHAGMTNRLQSDVSIRRLLLLPDINRNNNSNTVNSNNNSNVDEGITLCEALIQRNRTTQLELEERVNVDEGVLDGIRTAIYSHAEDNLDILDLLLNMPYLPRSSGGGSGALILPQSNDAKGRGGEHEGEDINDIPPSASSSSTTSDEADTIMIIINELAQRAYLRLLEDAMFDACEKEGEDELLDDLTIT